MPRAKDEPVRLTKIYTRGGDAGETSLGDGSRVSKRDPRITAYGAVDELNAAVGVVLAGDAPGLRSGPVLERVQNELFDLGADLSVPAPRRGPASRRAAARRPARGGLRSLQRRASRAQELRSPGGTPTAAALHVARTICRRAEREAIDAAEAVEISAVRGRRHLNRLSDLLFILSRTANAESRSATSPSGSPARHDLSRPILTTAFRLGATSFGGPVAHVGYFRDEYVDAPALDRETRSSPSSSR